MAYASANLYPDTTGHASEIAATTTVIIIYTLYVHGGLTIQMCHWLGISTGVDAAAMSAKVCQYTESLNRISALSGI